MVVSRVEWLLLFELVETRAVLHVFDVWDERRLLVSYVVPIDSFEEFVVLDLLDSAGAESIVHITEKPFQDICCLGRELGIVRNRKRLAPVQDLLAGHAGLVGEEGWVAHQHLEQNCSARPPINGLVVATLAEDLRRYVVWCSNSREGQLPVSHILGSFVGLHSSQIRVPSHRLFGNVAQVISHLLINVFTLRLDFYVLAQTEVAQLDVSILTNYEIVRFEVPMYVIQIVHTFNGEDGLSNIEPGHVLTQDVFLHQQRHEVSSLQVFHDQVEVVLVLEGAFEFDDPWVIGEGQDIALGTDMRDLILEDHLGLLHLFDGDHLVCLPVSANADLTESTTADDLLWCVVLHRHLGPL